MESAVWMSSCQECKGYVRAGGAALHVSTGQQPTRAHTSEVALGLDQLEVLAARTHVLLARLDLKPEDALGIGLA